MVRARIGRHTFGICTPVCRLRNANSALPRIQTHKYSVCLLSQKLPTFTMPAPSNTLLIEGSFEELAEELARYIDDVKKKPSDESTGVQSEIAPLLEKGQKDEALRKLVTGSTALSSAPEKGKTN